jgi:hypothetical protein
VIGDKADVVEEETMEMPWGGALLWGFVASAVMITILQGSQSLGLSRLNLPFLIGTLFTGERTKAVVIGMTVYMLGGWAFALLYFYAFLQLGLASWWLGAAAGFLHGLVLITVVLPLLPVIHPRMAWQYDGPSGPRRLEPPGAFGLHYGRPTPLTTVIAQTVYGLILGAVYPLL